MFARRLLHPHSRPRWTAHTAVLAGAGNARATLTLALAAFGLINVIGSLGVPWSSLVTTLLLALCARAFFAMAQRAPDKRFAWLLSASVAAGLTIADISNLVSTAPSTWAAVVVTCIAVLPLVVRQRHWSRPTYEGSAGATHGELEQQTAAALREAPDATEPPRAATGS